MYKVVSKSDSLCLLNFQEEHSNIFTVNENMKCFLFDFGALSVNRTISGKSKWVLIYKFLSVAELNGFTRKCLKK